MKKRGLIAILVVIVLGGSIGGYLISQATQQPARQADIERLIEEIKQMIREIGQQTPPELREQIRPQLKMLEQQVEQLSQVYKQLSPQEVEMLIQQIKTLTQQIKQSIPQLKQQTQSTETPQLNHEIIEMTVEEFIKEVDSCLHTPVVFLRDEQIREINEEIQNWAKSTFEGKTVRLTGFIEDLYYSYDKGISETCCIKLSSSPEEFQEVG